MNRSLFWEQGVGGSNPLTPTDDRLWLVDIKPFFIEGLLFYQKLSGLYRNYTNKGYGFKGYARVHVKNIELFGLNSDELNKPP